MHVFIRINSLRARGHSWGDVQYAEGLARAIRRQSGHQADLIYRGEVPAASDSKTVLLQICGPHLEEPVTGITNLLWMISPPNIMPIGMLARYQGVFIASERLTSGLKRLGLAAEFLPQATETAHFSPDRRPARGEEFPIVFVGSYAPRVDRRLVLSAVEMELEPQIWGPGWKGIIPDRLWRGERLDYDQLAEVYASARIVLNSHMASMARQGFMNNRSFDALSSGALVVSDKVLGFADPELPELHQIDHLDALPQILGELLAAPPADADARQWLHRQMIERYSFDSRAAAIIARASVLLESQQVAPPAISVTKPATLPVLVQREKDLEDLTDATLVAAQEITMTARHLERGQRPLPPGPESPLIHALSADLHNMRQVASEGLTSDRIAALEPLVARARRLLEALPDAPDQRSIRIPAADRDRILSQIIRNEPLWPHAPEGFQRESGKRGLALRPRAQRPGTARAIGVFLHLYYDELAPVFGEWLANIEMPTALYVSTDTEAKAERIRAALPYGDVRVFDNRGRDIWPKLFGFRKEYEDHDIILHLHGKRSPHATRLDSWLDHILNCLLGSAKEVNRILSLFDAVPRLGMVVPVTFRGVLGAAHWGANRDIARELARRLGMKDELPDENQLRFPVGSMFWARSAAIRPLLDLNLPQNAFPHEAGQVDGTLAHALERMLGVTCQSGGSYVLPVMGANSNLHRRHQIPFTTNRALREALESGELAL